MKKPIIFALLSLCFASCSKMKTYTCTCKYKAIDGVPGIPKEINETTTVKGRTFEKASSTCQLDNRTKHTNSYYHTGVCTIVQ